MLWLILPARLLHSGYFTPVGQLAQADAADTEFAVVAARAATELAAVISANLELGLPALLCYEALLGHIPSDSAPGFSLF